MSNLQHSLPTAFVLFSLLLLHNPAQVQCHNKHNHPPVPKSPTPPPSPPPPASVPQPRHDDPLTCTDTLEQQFRAWVKLVCSLEQSLFPKAVNVFRTNRTIVVGKHPRPGVDFTSIQAAINSIPIINTGRVVIKVNAGVYREKVRISPLQSYITIEGAGADETIVEWGGEEASLGSLWPLGDAFASATLTVDAPYFIAKNITFKNTTPVSVSRGGLRLPGGLQGIAVRVSGDASSFLGCKFLGARNTLHDHLGRHYYKDCYIEGSLDFIFGKALSLFEGCHLNGLPDVSGAIGSDLTLRLMESLGSSYVGCRLTGSAALFVGRSLGVFPKVVLSNCFLDHIVVPQHWETLLSLNQKIVVSFGQHKCRGPGLSFRGKLYTSVELGVNEAKPFLSLTLVDGFDWVKF